MHGKTSTPRLITISTLSLHGKNVCAFPDYVQENLATLPYLTKPSNTLP